MEHVHEQLVAAATDWVEQTTEVTAIVLYGSLAQGRGHPLSDVDLVIVAQPGRREALWSNRDDVAAALLGQPVAWGHELPWQRPYRYQAWAADLKQVDLTFDEESIEPSPTLRDGFRVLVDKTGATGKLATDLDQLTGQLESQQPDPGELDGSTWVWFLGIHGWLQNGRCWQAYTNLVQLIDTRIAPLLADGPSYKLEDAALVDRVDQLHGVVPASPRRDDVARALAAAVRLYDSAVGSWTRRIGHAPPSSPLAPQIRRVLIGHLEPDS